MIISYSGDMFAIDAQVLVNTVNCVGVMGKGVALQFKRRYPDMFEHYRRMCLAGQMRTGRPKLWRESTPWVLNFPTKQHWRNPSQLRWIVSGLEYFRDNYRRAGIESIVFPRLGCGNGGLHWPKVRETMELALLDLTGITIYIPDSR